MKKLWKEPKLLIKAIIINPEPVPISKQIAGLKKNKINKS